MPVQVNDVGFEPLQAALTARLDVLRSAIRCRRPAWRTQIAELAGDYILVAMVLYRASDQLLVAAQTVGVRAVEEFDADLARAAQGVDRGIAVGLI